MYHPTCRLNVSFDFLQAINMLHVRNWAKEKERTYHCHEWIDQEKIIPLDQLSSTLLGEKHCPLTMKSSWLQHVMHLYACLYLNTFSRVVAVLQHQKQAYSLQKWWIIVITANYSIKQMNVLKPATSGSVFPSQSLSDPWIVVRGKAQDKHKGTMLWIHTWTAHLRNGVVWVVPPRRSFSRIKTQTTMWATDNQYYHPFISFPFYF